MLNLPLGPANPRLTTHCRGTLALAAAGILTRLRCYYRQDLQSGPLQRTSRPAFCAAPTPPYRIRPVSGLPRGLGGRLKPRAFSAPPASAGELLRTHYGMAASKPTPQLSSAGDLLLFDT